MSDPVQATSWWQDFWEVLQPILLSVIAAAGVYAAALLRSAAAKRNLQTATLENMTKAMTATATKVDEVHAATVVTSSKVDEVQVAQVVDAAVSNEKLDQIVEAVKSNQPDKSV